METAVAYTEDKRRMNVEDVEDFLQLADSLQTISRDALEQALDEDTDVSIMYESYRNILLLSTKILENGAATHEEYKLGVYKSDEGIKYTVSITLGETEDGEFSYVTRVRRRDLKAKRKNKRRAKETREMKKSAEKIEKSEKR